MGKEKRVRKVEMRGRENMVKSERFSEDDGDFIMACAIKCQWEFSIMFKNITENVSEPGTQSCLHVIPSFCPNRDKLN